jgi:large subunit ribosomal protein L23
MALFGTKKNTSNEEKVTKSAPVVKKNVPVAAPVSMKDLYAAAPVKTAKGAAKVAKVGLNHELSYRLLVKPLITEKATNLSAENKYVFVVSIKANKIEIAKAIEATYGVKPLAINIINRAGKKVARGKVRGQRKDWKKAIVTLKKGETIKIYEGV